MRVWPAIDLRHGQCVRLQQGDYQRQTVFGEDPLVMARTWIEQGADCLHLVDLDAARDGNNQALESPNRRAIGAIAAGTGVACQLGGGVRSETDIRRWLDAGLARLVIGTRALKEPDWFAHMCRQYPGRLVLGLDARDGWVATDGWLETSQVRAIDLALRFVREPLAAIVYTDIARDGMLQGPNVEATAALARAVPIPLIASGGVTSAADVAQLAEAGLAGCIIGRALYEGRLRLAEALSAAQTTARSGVSEDVSVGSSLPSRTRFSHEG